MSSQTTNFPKLFSFERAKIMAVINTTPDSFYKNSRSQTEKDLLYLVENALNAGADWLDIGGVSTRPGSSFVDVEKERNRVIPAIQLIKKEFPEAILSVDTFRSEIAREALDFGASIINDVSYGADNKLLTLCAERNVPYVLMHMRGTPDNMMQNTNYEHVVRDVYTELFNKQKELIQLGLKRLIIDPGFGFSKTLEQNYQLMHQLDFFKNLNAPILVGISRKSMIYTLLNTDPDAALNGTTALHTIALLKGAHILRVHDVKEAVEVRKIVEQLNAC
jgi:dihydropteroate synthase